MRPIDPTCGGLLPDGVEPDAPALYGADGRLLLDQRALRAQVEGLARPIGEAPKGLAFLLCRNTPSILTGFYALLAAGHAVALLDAKLEPAALRRLIDLYAPEWVIGAEGDLEALDPGGEPRRESWGALSALAAAAPAPGGIHPDAAVLLSTSGTTGSAKFVRLSPGNVRANADQIAQVLEIGARDVGSAHLPLHYSYGLSVVTSHLRRGAAVHLWDDSVTVPEFWAAAAQAGITQFPGVPFHYNFLARSDLDRLVPASLKTFTQAGGALDLRLQKHMNQMCERSGRRFYVMYGQTEASPRITTLPYDRLPEKLGSVGVALPGGTLEVVDEQGEPLPAGQAGRVLYRGPNVMLGYAEGRADLARGDDQHGRIETGDLGRLDAEGYLFLSGRAKRFAKLFGLRISLDEVEARLRSGGEVAAVEGRDKIAVFTADPAAVAPLLPAMASEYKLPVASFVVKEVADLPRKGSGKIDYAKLEAPR